MQALSDDQQLARLEQKVAQHDVKFEEVIKALAEKPDRTETRSEFRTLLTIMLAMWVTMIFGLAGILIQLN
jgi:hypothetical protein